jgi:4-aminobutyrate aminotransferase
MIASDAIMDWPPGAHASTFGGNPISCAAALETIALLEEKLIENAAVVGSYLLARLHDLAQRHALVGDVRGKGLMIGIDLVRDRQTKQPAVSERDAVVNACFQQGLLVLGCGPSTIRLSPPLIVTREDADTAVDILDRVLGAAAAKSDDE